MFNLLPILAILGALVCGLLFKAAVRGVIDQTIEDEIKRRDRIKDVEKILPKKDRLTFAQELARESETSGKNRDLYR